MRHPTFVCGAELQHKPEPGFTLIELLVVLTVIGILASLLLPVLARAKSGALRVACLNNLRQIGISFRYYLDDFRCYPSFQADGVAGARTGFWDAKLVAAQPLTTKTFLCPANLVQGTTMENNWSPTLTNPITGSKPQPWANLSYGYNGTGTAPDEFPVSTPSGWEFLGFGGERPTGNGVAFVHTYVPESQVGSPSDMIEVADYDLLTTDDDNDGDLHPELLFFGITGRHARGANVLFCDTHVEYNKTNRWTERTDTAWRRWNYDHQPHRN